MRMSTIPRDGSSGGPIVDSAGSVVGMIRGSTHQYGDRAMRGFATPAERLFECELKEVEMCHPGPTSYTVGQSDGSSRAFTVFQLPNFTPSSVSSQKRASQTDQVHSDGKSSDGE